MQLEVTGKNLTDTINRKEALEEIQNHATTEALVFLAEMVKRKGASEKLLSKKGLIKTFL